jgi:hypothetical protein
MLPWLSCVFVIPCVILALTGVVDPSKVDPAYFIVYALVALMQLADALITLNTLFSNFKLFDAALKA